MVCLNKVLKSANKLTVAYPLSALARTESRDHVIVSSRWDDHGTVHSMSYCKDSSTVLWRLTSVCEPDARTVQNTYMQEA